MQLLLERTKDTVGDFKERQAAVWAVLGGDGSRLGIAVVAEIVAAPPVDCLTLAQTRVLLGIELGTPAPRMRVQPTEKMVGDAFGVPQRLWIGSTDKGLTVAAFITRIITRDAEFSALISEHLMRQVPDGLDIDPVGALR